MEKERRIAGTTRSEEEAYLDKTLRIVKRNVRNYEQNISQMQEEIDEMLEHYHDNDVEVYTSLSNTVTMRDNMELALMRNRKAMKKPYFGRIVFYDETYHKEESLYIGRGGIAGDATHQVVIDWRAPVSNAYYENGLGRCSYPAPDGKEFPIDLKLKRTYEIEEGRLLDYFDTEVIANDELLTKYLAKNKQAVLGEIVATIQKEQNEIIRKSPYHNMIVQGVAGSGKTTVAMHRISYILYNYQERFRPDDFYIVGSNRILLEYITGVLPDLDVYGIRQMTMEELFVRLLYEDWDEKKYQIADESRHGGRGRERGGLEWFRKLEQYCRELEENVICTDSVYLNPRQFVEGIQDGVIGVFDRSDGTEQQIELLSGTAIREYLMQNRNLSIQTKINMLNERLIIKIKDEFLKYGIRYTEKERRAVLKAYRGRFGKRVWKRSIFDMYREFLGKHRTEGAQVSLPDKEFDVYDLAALAYLYKRVKETEVISEAHHIVIDEAQDYGMMAYAVLDFCIKDCTYTVMGDVSQNIHFGYGLNDWEELKELLLSGKDGSFGLLKKSYRNTVEISDFAMNILRHGHFVSYPAEPIIRHGNPVKVKQLSSWEGLMREAADICGEWLKKGYGTIAVICRSRESAREAERELAKRVPVVESRPDKMVFTEGIMVLPVSYTKGLEFDAVLILDPERKEYPVDDGHAKLLYVAATRALHELCILHRGNLTGLIADPLPSGEAEKQHLPKAAEAAAGDREKPKNFICEKPAAFACEKPTAAIRKKPSAVLKAPKPVKEPPKTILLTGPAALSVKKVSISDGKKGEADSLQRHVSGDVPGPEMLRVPGHSRIDLSVKWVLRKPDGLYLQSRYGVLRLSPIKANVVRITFVREGQPEERPHPKAPWNTVDSAWLYREKETYVELKTDRLICRVDKLSGAIQYMDQTGRLLLEEKSSACRQIDLEGKGRAWTFFKWKKEEQLSAPGPDEGNQIQLSRGAHWVGMDNCNGKLPVIISDRGYGITVATDRPVICCDIPAYGSYLMTEGDGQMDYYFEKY